jgi:SAM-dependent methyltransferase
MNPKVVKRLVGSLPPNARVLDAGCGSGNNSRYLLSLRPDLKITGLDIDPQVRRQVPEGVFFRQGSVLHLKAFRSETFDAVLCFHLLEHLSDPRLAVSELGRVLKKGGVLLAECPHWVCAFLPIGSNFYDDPTHIRPHSKESFKELFKAFNVESLEVDEPIMFHMPALYGIPTRSATHALRKILSWFGLFRIAVFLAARKPASSSQRPRP